MSDTVEKTLIERLGEASEGSDDLSKAVLTHLGFRQYEDVPIDGHTYWGRDSKEAIAWRVSTSLDAAVALVERVSSKCTWEIKWTGEIMGSSFRRSTIFTGEREYDVYDKPQALGLCIALLRALEEK